jgi:hypothetical protein
MPDRLRGHKVTWDATARTWRYADGEAVTPYTQLDRACTKCGLPPTPEGHDACIANLPGVRNACCGHGHTEDAYVSFDNGHVRRGAQAIAAMERAQRVTSARTRMRRHP